MSSPRYRTLFLSDLHLGAIGSRPDLVLAFLRANPAATYVLAGDVLDLWQPLLPHWRAEDQAVIDHLNQRQADGATLVWLRGNHDPDPMRAPAHVRLNATPVTRHVHTAADGTRFLVVHGDEADSRLVRAHVMTRLGSRIDHGLRRLDHRLRWLGRGARGEARSAIEALLMSLNRWAYARRAHERRLVAMARAEGLDGVICGHFHIAGLHADHGLIYANCGDWVDSFTGLIERRDGAILLSGGRAAPGATARPGGDTDRAPDLALART
ncbi:MAG: UDP-2,3-diacylglucosamine diphosphatase [Rhodobacteraceae bacterium]|nr:UDP-2,3-diacylglucosamine diphosphatase [Paracoccaceae bacterium]